MRPRGARDPGGNRKQAQERNKQKGAIEDKIVISFRPEALVRFSRHHVTLDASAWARLHDNPPKRILPAFLESSVTVENPEAVRRRRRANSGLSPDGRFPTSHTELDDCGER